MPKKENKKVKPSLGKALMRDLQNRRTFKTNNIFSDGGLDFSLGTTSVTKQTTLDEFICNADMENRDFTAVRNTIQLVDASSINSVLSMDQQVAIKQKHTENKHLLSIPRRPVWDTSMTKEELEEQENKSFLEWRKQILEVKNRDDLVMTPYEINMNFWRQLWRVVERGDILVQIVDARNPLQFRCEDLERYVLEVDPKKINIILMNKSDLLTPEQRKTWADYFKSISLPVIFFSALEQSEAEECEVGLPLPSPFDGSLYNREQLIQYFETIPLETTHRTIAMVGYPNVGKSSTINALMQCKTVSVSSRPGKTKHFQTHILTEDVLTLCDCPGLVFPSFAISKADMVLNGILPIDNLDDYKSPIGLITSRIPRHILREKYKIFIPRTYTNLDSVYTTAAAFLNSFAFERKYTTGHGNPDCARASRVILKDFSDGELVYCTAPPNFDQDTYHAYPHEEEDLEVLKKMEDEELKRLPRHHHLMLKTFGLADKEKEFNLKEEKRATEEKVEKYFEALKIPKDEPQTWEERAETKPWKRGQFKVKKGPKVKLRILHRELDEH